jgi:hypothetical protein
MSNVYEGSNRNESDAVKVVYGPPQLGIGFVSAFYDSNNRVIYGSIEDASSLEAAQLRADARGKERNFPVEKVIVVRVHGL